MNEFIDPVLGRMVAVNRDTASCADCAYLEMICPDVRDGEACCTPSFRNDRQFIIWVRAEDARQKPTGVRLTDRQIEAVLDGLDLDLRWDLQVKLARAIESAALHANNLEVKATEDTKTSPPDAA